MDYYEQKSYAMVLPVYLISVSLDTKMLQYTSLDTCKLATGVMIGQWFNNKCKLTGKTIVYSYRGSKEQAIILYTAYLHISLRLVLPQMFVDILGGTIRFRFSAKNQVTFLRQHNTFMYQLNEELRLSFVSL